MTSSLSVLSELQQRLVQDGANLDDEFNAVAQILTPSQLAKFVIWVNSNPACMHMLNDLWGKVYQPKSPMKSSSTPAREEPELEETIEEEDEGDDEDDE